MSKVHVIDASAAMAYLQQEQGEDAVEAILATGPCWMTTVNLCEVLGKLCDKGIPPERALAAVEGLGVIAVDFDTELAQLAAFMKVRTKVVGASLGDRACLALAERVSQTRDVPIVVTAERVWSKVKWPFKVVLIR